MSDQVNTIRPTLFVPLRLTSYIILIGVLVFRTGFPGWMQATTIAYSLATLALAFGIAFDHKAAVRYSLRYVVAIQFLLEITMQAGIIYMTGNLHSAFSALFVLTIVSASLWYRLAGTIAVATIVSATYSMVLLLAFDHGNGELLSLESASRLLESGGSIVYAVSLHVLVFYLVAFIAGYLAERISSQDKRLAFASRQLRMAKSETDDILRHLNSGLLTIDRNGSIIYFNRAAERILGYEEKKIRGLHCRAVFADRMPEFGATLMQGIDDGITHPRKQVDILSCDGERVPVGLSTSILTEDEKRLRGVIAIFSDLTEAKRLEEKIRVADGLAAVGELSASIAHEIRNPLTAIAGSVEVLSGELTLDGENERLMQVIMLESRRLNKILTDFLTFAGINRPAYNKVELCHVMSDIVELLRHHQAFGEQIEIDFVSDEAMVYVVGDENLIRQLLQNLLINACEAINSSLKKLDDGRIRLSLKTNHSSGKVLLSISDNGSGIEKKHHEEIFRPFYSTKKKGSGLGLAIVHRICSSLKLSIHVESEIGQGTTFKIYFPLFGQERPDTAVTAEKALS